MMCWAKPHEGEFFICNPPWDSRRFHVEPYSWSMWNSSTILLHYLVTIWTYHMSIDYFTTWLYEPTTLDTISLYGKSCHSHIGQHQMLIVLSSTMCHLHRMPHYLYICHVGASHWPNWTPNVSNSCYTWKPIMFLCQHVEVMLT